MTADRIIRWAPPLATFQLRMRWRAMLAAAEARLLAAALKEVGA